MHDRHELDVREAELVRVGDELVGEVASSRGPAARTPHAPRRSRAAPSAAARPAAVRARRCRSTRTATCRSWTRSSVDLRVEGKGVGLEAQLPVRAVHLVLVAVAFQRPRARLPPRCRRSPAARADSPARPSGSSRRRRRPRARWEPRRRTRRPRRRRGRRAARRSARGVHSPARWRSSSPILIVPARASRRIPATGIETQSGRLPSSCRISWTAFSSSKTVSSRSIDFRSGGSSGGSTVAR